MVPLESAPASSDEWQFSIRPYAWLAGLEGTVGIRSAVSEVDLSFGDVFENLALGALFS
jgi:hypothetical protein